VGSKPRRARNFGRKGTVLPGQFRGHRPGTRRAPPLCALGDLAPVRDWVGEGAPGVFVIDGKIGPHPEADWHAEHFP
jgi:hypothetical protein